LAAAAAVLLLIDLICEADANGAFDIFLSHQLARTTDYCAAHRQSVQAAADCAKSA
jgi:hypothetical protein